MIKQEFSELRRALGYERLVVRRIFHMYVSNENEVIWEAEDDLQMLEEERQNRIRDILKELLSTAVTVKTHPAEVEQNAVLYGILSEIDSADRFNEFQNVFVESKMTELIACVLYSVMRDEQIEKNKHIVVQNDDVKKIEEVREQMQLKPYDDYFADEIARSLSMSVSKLNRIFRGLYGISLHAYLKNQRLEYAAGLLVETDMTVTEAAYASGYNNISLFSRSFSDKYGITPKKFSMSQTLNEKC